jgi:sugar lactone lactonase YvrE
MNYKVNQVSSIKCALGEGLIWDDRSSRLLMTDISNGKLIELDVQSTSNRHWQFNEPLAWVLPTTLGNKYLLGLKSGIALFDIRRPENIVWVNQDFPEESYCRLNDACVDSTGRVWYGSMNMQNPSFSDGHLASFSSKEGLHIHDEGFTVTNGPVISPDGDFLFFNDTLQGVVYRYCVETYLGKLSDRQVFIKFSADQGYPDGMCFDIKGNLWIALWGGASVVQLSPNGELLSKIFIPALNVTNICFCGPKLDRLLVSTASIGLSEAEVQRYPDSGGLFEICGHQSTGVPPYLVILEPSWT